MSSLFRLAIEAIKSGQIKLHNPAFQVSFMDRMSRPAKFRQRYAADELWNFYQVDYLCLYIMCLANAADTPFFYNDCQILLERQLTIMQTVPCEYRELYMMSG